LDNRLVIMPIEKANDLLFPGEPLHVTSCLLVLRNTADLALVQKRVMQLAAENNLPLEARTCWELNPHHVRSIHLMDMCFVFTFCIIAVVLVFTIYNTVMMSIVERTREIGALRAIGFARGAVIKMYTQEGFILGVMGGLAGLALGFFAAWLINRANILYMPPQVNLYAKIQVMPAHRPLLTGASFVACLFVALVAAFFPARRASRMEIAEALRH
jgi:putative ABC transport system permease protein